MVPAESNPRAELEERLRFERLAADLRTSEARLAAGTELAGLGYYEADYGQRTCFLDKAFRDICGVPAEVQQGLDPVRFWQDHVHPDDRQLLSQQREKLHNGKVDRISAEYRYLHPTHGQRWLHHSARFAGRSAVRGEIRTYGVVRDITPQKQAELEALNFDVRKWAAPEFLEQAAKELLEEQWEKVTTSKLPETTELLKSSQRVG
jgi:PAS domain S-box-containing protein